MTTAQGPVRDSHGSVGGSPLEGLEQPEHADPERDGRGDLRPFGFTDPMRYMLIGAAANATASGIQRDRGRMPRARNAHARSAAPSRELAIRIA